MNHIWPQGTSNIIFKTSLVTSIVPDPGVHGLDLVPVVAARGFNFKKQTKWQKAFSDPVILCCYFPVISWYCRQPTACMPESAQCYEWSKWKTLRQPSPPIPCHSVLSCFVHSKRQSINSRRNLLLLWTNTLGSLKIVWKSIQFKIISTTYFIFYQYAA